MADGIPPLDRGNWLLQRYRQRTITLEECREFQRLLEEVYLRNPTVSDLEKTQMALILAGVNAKRFDLEFQAQRRQKGRYD